MFESKPDRALTDPDKHGPEDPPTAPVVGLSAGEMTARSQAATLLMKSIGHEGRLMILCHLSSGEKSVTALETLLESRQAAVSQQLARLRRDGLVRTRRDGKTIFYALNDTKAARVVGLLYDLFCKDN